MVVLIKKINQPAVPKSKAAFTSDELKAAKQKTFTCQGKGLAHNALVANMAGEGRSRIDDHAVTAVRDGCLSYSPLEGTSSRCARI
jgi:hypothetical protein